MADFLSRLLDGIGSLNDTAEGRMRLRSMAGQDVDYNSKLYNADVTSQENDAKRAAAEQSSYAMQSLAQQDFSQGYNPEVTKALIAAGRVEDAMSYYKTANKALEPKLQFNPVTGEMFDMRSGTPYQASGGMAQGNEAAPDMGRTDLPPMPNGLNPLQQKLWNEQAIKQKFEETKPMTPKELADQQRLDEKAATEKAAAEESTINAVNLFDQQYQLQKQAIASARQKMSNPLATGGANQATGWWDSSPAGSLNSDLEVLQSNAMLDAMTQLKEASKTGATGLGSQTEKEGARLITSRGNIKGSQKAEDLRRYLDIYEKNLDASRANIIAGTKKYYPQYGQPAETEAEAPAATQQQPASSGGVSEGAVIVNDAGEQLVLRNGQWVGM